MLQWSTSVLTDVRSGLHSCSPVWSQHPPLPRPSGSTAQCRWPGSGYSGLDQRPFWGTCQKPPDSHRHSTGTAARSHLKDQELLTTGSFLELSHHLWGVRLIFHPNLVSRISIFEWFCPHFSCFLCSTSYLRFELWISILSALQIWTSFFPTCLTDGLNESRACSIQRYHKATRPPRFHFQSQRITQLFKR